MVQVSANEVTTGELNIAKNGTYDVVKYRNVKVDVSPSEVDILGVKNITKNGEENVVGYSKVKVKVEGYKIIKYVAVTKGNHAGGTVQVTRYAPDGTSETRTTFCNSNDSAGWPELSVWAWEQWHYQFFSFGTVYLDGILRQHGNQGLFASYDSGDGATHTHTVEV